MQGFLYVELLAKAEADAVSSDKATLLGKKMDMYTLRKTLQQRKPRHVTLYEEMRTGALGELYTFLVYVTAL